MSLKNKTKHIFLQTFLPLLIYIVLFEFIIPVNKFFPKPSLIFDSIKSIFVDYDVISGIAISSTAVYLGIILSYLLIKLIFPSIIKIFYKSIYLVNYFIPSLIFLIIWVFWFGSSIIAELVFVSLWGIFNLINQAKFTDYSKISEHEKFIRLNAINSTIGTKLKFNVFYNKLYLRRNKFHIKVWGIALIYEFIAQTGGLGSNLFQLFSNYDLSGLFAIAISISIFIYVGDKIFNLVWEKIK